MTRQPFTHLRAPILVLPQRDIDTDQIIPARFLTTTERDGLGRFAFTDWRKAPGSPLDDQRAARCEILVAGDNFGCGSSREHAPWALLDLGIRAVISTSFADIFRQNAHKNGLLTVQVEPETHIRLLADPWAEVAIDIEARTLVLPDGATASFPLDDFTRQCLLQGVDEFGYLLGFEAQITAFEQRGSTEA
jgi:3-isopropylmalate/(R)-2-methylmalate dehydratase small subunit